MKRVFVEAYEDESRPQGGHAVIVIQGLDAVSDRPQFRLKPLDGGFIAGRRSGPKSNMLTPVATRLTESGVELVVGPDLVSHPLLLAGTPVVIELPDAGVRGEFLWPNVAPLAQPRRRNVVVARKPRIAAASASPAAEAEPASIPSAASAQDLGLSVLEPSGDPAALAAGGAQRAWSGSAGGDGKSIDPTGGAASHSDAVRDRIELLGIGGDPVSAASGASSSEQNRSQEEHSPIHWKGRQATSRARRRKWLAPAVAAVTAAGLVGLYLVPGDTSGPSGSTPAAARDKSRPATAARQSSGESRLVPAEGASRSQGAERSAHAGLSPAVTSGAGQCGKPEVSTDPLDGGRMRIRITAPCKGEEEIRLSYGGGTFVHRLDEEGALDLVFDCFAGPATPVEVRFADGRVRSLPVVANDFARISKVAVMWRPPVNLDLHAFEYAALRDERGHVFERTPGTASTALRETEATARGRGFMSTSDGGRSAGDKLEVYTYFHADAQQTGAVDFALDFESRGDNPAAGTCGTDANAEVPFRVSLLARGTLSVEEGRIAAAECGQPISPEARYRRDALPIIKVRK